MLFMSYPTCKFCYENSGIIRAAGFIAAESTDQGKTGTWELVCAGHADGWSNGRNWEAPLYPLTIDLTEKTLLLPKKKYTVEIKEVHTNRVTVEAHSVEDALEEAGNNSDDGEELEYEYSLPRDQWNVILDGEIIY